MAGSRSANLSDDCELAGRKAKFVIQYKEQLIEEMRQIKLAFKPYKIHLFVNSRFFERMQNVGP